MNNLINYFVNIYKDNSRWLRSTFLLFVFGIALGAITFFVSPELLLEIIASFEERFGVDPALNLDLVREIFLQNVMVSLIAIFGGIIFGFIPIFIVLVNGFLLGFIAVSVILLSEEILGSTYLLLGGLVPHGIIELPAFLLASAIGLRLGMEWLSGASNGKRVAVLKNNFFRSVKYLPGLVVLLLLSALIEVFVSGRIVDK